MAEEIHTLVCSKCGADVSGPDQKDAKATMERHEAKKHPKVVKK
jgi:hypothetical protein